MIDNIGSLKVKDILLQPIHRGSSPRYSKNGDIPVVKTRSLKNGYIEVSQQEFVERSFYLESTRLHIQKGDILIASTGKISLGKIDILEEDCEVFPDGHLSIIRIDLRKYKPLFFVYFFRSILGYFQIERDFTGLTNQIELYANEIVNFKIPKINLENQERIVNEVKKKLDEQDKINNQIQKLRDQIDQIIKESIKGELYI